ADDSAIAATIARVASTRLATIAALRSSVQRPAATDSPARFTIASVSGMAARNPSHAIAFAGTRPGWRETIVTSWPAAPSARATGAPIHPVPPVTRTRMARAPTTRARASQTPLAASAAVVSVRPHDHAARRDPRDRLDDLAAGSRLLRHAGRSRRRRDQG